MLLSAVSPALVDPNKQRQNMKLDAGKKLILIMLADVTEALKLNNGIDPHLVKEAIYS